MSHAAPMAVNRTLPLRRAPDRLRTTWAIATSARYTALAQDRFAKFWQD
jgi:hypothetical protein